MHSEYKETKMYACLTREYKRTKANTTSNKAKNYYATQTACLGEKYLTFLFRQHSQQRINEYQLADYLDVKTDSLAALEGFYLKQKTSDALYSRYWLFYYKSRLLS